MQVKDDLTHDTCTLHILCFQDSHCLAQPLSSVTTASVPLLVPEAAWVAEHSGGGWHSLGLPPTPTSSLTFDSDVGGFTGCAQGRLWLQRVGT